MNNMEIRPWGYEQTLSIIRGGKVDSVEEEFFNIEKNLVIYAGHLLSLQYHNYRFESWEVKCGECRITIDKEKFSAFTGTIWQIPPKTIHRVEAVTNTVIKEFSTMYNHKDIIRLEDSYGRAK